MDTSSDEAIKVIKNWLATCSKNHQECGIPLDITLPRRVLNVTNSRVRLFETQGVKGKYLTLSYY